MTEQPQPAVPSTMLALMPGHARRFGQPQLSLRGDTGHARAEVGQDAD
jgi:hypothetical protein